MGSGSCSISRLSIVDHVSRELHLRSRRLLVPSWIGARASRAEDPVASARPWPLRLSTLLPWAAAVEACWRHPDRNSLISGARASERGRRRRRDRPGREGSRTCGTAVRTGTAGQMTSPPDRSARLCEQGLQGPEGRTYDVDWLHVVVADAPEVEGQMRRRQDGHGHHLTTKVPG